MNITVDVRGVDAVKAHLSGMGKQVSFAASKALNATGKAIADAMPGSDEVGQSDCGQEADDSDHNHDLIR